MLPIALTPIIVCVAFFSLGRSVPNTTRCLVSRTPPALCVCTLFALFALLVLCCRCCFFHSVEEEVLVRAASRCSESGSRPTLPKSDKPLSLSISRFVVLSMLIGSLPDHWQVRRSSFAFFLFSFLLAPFPLLLSTPPLSLSFPFPSHTSPHFGSEDRFTKPQHCQVLSPFEAGSAFVESVHRFRLSASRAFAATFPLVWLPLRLCSQPAPSACTQPCAFTCLSTTTTTTTTRD